MDEPVFSDPSRDDDPARSTLAHVRDVSEELVRLARATATRALGEAPLVTVLRALLPEIERVYAEREQLADEIRHLREEATTVDARVRHLEMELAGHAARSAAEHVAFEAERDRARTLATDLARQGDALALAATREQQLRSDIESQASRAAAEREDALGLAREMVQAAEDARAAAANELETLRARLTAARDVPREDTSRHDAELARQGEAGPSAVEAALAAERARTQSLEHALVNAETAAAVAAERANMLAAELAAARAAPDTAPIETPIGEPGLVQVELEPMVAEPESVLLAESEPEPAFAEPEPTLDDPEPCLTEPEPIAAAAEPELTEPADAEPEPIADQPALTRQRLAVIDTGGAWDSPPDVQAEPLPVGPEITDRVRELAPDACVVNLASAAALAAVTMLRAAEVATPLWGCAVAPNGNVGIVLGPFAVLARPVDPAGVCASLGEVAPRGSGAIVVGRDTTTLMAVRQGLLQAGLSVRTAWNRSQANDLVESVHPGTVIVDLASEPASAAELIADLARHDMPPLLVLIPGSAQQQDDFAAALAARAFDATGGGRADLLAAAARA